MAIVEWTGHKPLMRNRIRYRARTYRQSPVRVVQWFAQAMVFAIEHGWHPAYPLTSGFRPGRDSHTASGDSNHRGESWNDGKFPCGAGDFGGYDNPAGLKSKSDMIRICHEHRYTGHIPEMPKGFHDDGHCSCDGH